MVNEAERVLREEPFPGFVGTVGKMDVAGTEFLAPLGDLYQFFLVNGTGHMLVTAEADTETEIRTDTSAGAYQKISEEAEAVLQ